MQGGYTPWNVQYFMPTVWAIQLWYWIALFQYPNQNNEVYIMKKWNNMSEGRFS